MKKGDVVEVTPVTIKGPIIKTEWNESAESLQHCIEWTDAEGNQQHRWFLETELQLVGSE